MGLPETERVAALRLARSAEIGPITYRNLIDRFGSASAAIEALPALAARGGRAAQIRVASRTLAQAEMERAEVIGARLLVLGEDDYPLALAAAEPAPPVLFVRGDIGQFSRSMIAMVGARNASANGRKFATTLAAGLGSRGHVIVSGLARGIDAAAHRGSLATGTVAVLAGGIDQIYPDEHRELAEEIASQGAIVSEMPIGHVARAMDFPRRNRIIAGLARATVVVEAAERSGSLITARLAAELGREVFAVPGSPLDARCRGTNGLLRDGATLIETPDDVEAHLPPMDAPPRAPVRKAAAQPNLDFNVSPAHAPAPRERPPARRSPLSQTLPEQIFGLLGPSPTPIDELVRATAASASDVQAALFDLELEGRAVRHPGQQVSGVPER